MAVVEEQAPAGEPADLPVGEAGRQVDDRDASWQREAAQRLLDPERALGVWWVSPRDGRRALSPARRGQRPDLPGRTRSRRGGSSRRRRCRHRDPPSRGPGPPLGRDLLRRAPRAAARSSSHRRFWPGGSQGASATASRRQSTRLISGTTTTTGTLAESWTICGRSLLDERGERCSRSSLSPRAPRSRSAAASRWRSRLSVKNQLLPANTTSASGASAGVCATSSRGPAP